MPSAGPANVRRTDTQTRQLTIAWDEVPCGSRRGSIIDYIYVFNSMSGIIQSDISNRQRTFYNLSPGTEYPFDIVATNSNGRGPAVYSTFSTLAGKYVKSQFHQIPCEVETRNKIFSQIFGLFLLSFIFPRCILMKKLIL